MSEQDFREAVAAGSSETSPRDTITRVKAAVIRQLERLDGRARIRSTDYFNHSFAPDLVLSWSTGPQRERFVYVRLTDEASQLLDDVNDVAAQRPIIFDVAASAGLPTQQAAGDLRERATASETLITTAGAIDSLVSQKSEEPVVGLLSSAVAQGGKGLLVRTDADRLGASVRSGFAGARTTSAQAVLSAATAVESVLEPRLAGRMTRLLQAVWIGSGGRLDLFPATRDLSGDIDDETLSFLLSLDDIEDASFWRRVGRGLALSQLGRLDVPDPSDNLHHLVETNLEVLWARAMRVMEEPAALDEVDLPVRWTVRRKSLTLRGSDFSAHVAEQVSDLADVPSFARDGVTVEELRARSAGLDVVSVQLADGREGIDFSSLSNQDVMASDRLTAVASSMTGASVRRARVSLPGGKGMNVDFNSSSASAITKGRLSLPQLLGAGLPLLHDLDDEAAAAIAALLPAGTADADLLNAETLFGDADADADLHAGS